MIMTIVISQTKLLQREISVCRCGTQGKRYSSISQI